MNSTSWWRGRRETGPSPEPAPSVPARRPRRIRSIVARTIGTGALGGAATGAVMAIVFLIGAAFEADSVRWGEFAVALVRLPLLCAVAGLPTGALVALPALIILVPAARWSARRPWAARVMGASACALSVGGLNTAAGLLTGGIRALLWLSPVLAVPALTMAVLIGAWRGPDLVSTPVDAGQTPEWDRTGTPSP
ncbi:hypothetical protein [Streptosporangium sp. NPDC000396]|uniref:hypothetical protein n=1 Tax=Streptosporangium sp. NPDC000396 TaxID=3366185 RepID=UPI0036B3ABB7